MEKLNKSEFQNSADSSLFEDLKEYSEIFGSDKEYSGWKPLDSTPSKPILVPGGDHEPWSTQKNSKKQKHDLEKRLLYRLSLAGQKKTTSEKLLSIKVKGVTDRLYRQKIGNTKNRIPNTSKLLKNPEKEGRIRRSKVEDRLLECDLAKKRKLRKAAQEQEKMLKIQSSPQISTYAKSIERNKNIGDRLYFFKDVYANNKKKMSKKYDQFSFSPRLFSTFASSNQKSRLSSNATPQLEKSVSYTSMYLHSKESCNSHDNCKNKSTHFTYFPVTNNRPISTAKSTQHPQNSKRLESSEMVKSMRNWKEMREEQLNSLMSSSRFDCYSPYDTEPYKTIERSQPRTKLQIPFGMYLKDNKFYTTR